ncbi:hypothetical protein NDU88_001581 [Pleurodeles waltl]|uniref:Uncharacterized protein n=1 Tax=Pleurodeles waltl TaxID=8319 RepID=A0AAV7R9I0_PLEWA|nr:hypothetical protein NDU88_001581 [Pleurodeles waltl]
MDVHDLAVEKGGKGVAEVLRRREFDGAGPGVGEFLDNAEELFAPVRVVVDAILLEGSLGGPDELVVLADGYLEGSLVALCLFVAPLLLDFSAVPLGGLTVGGEPNGLSAGVVVGRFPERSEGVGAVIYPLSEVGGGCVGVGGAGWWGTGKGGDQLVFSDLVRAAAGDLLWVVVSGGFLEGEVDAAVVGPVEFSGIQAI